MTRRAALLVVAAAVATALCGCGGMMTPLQRGGGPQKATYTKAAYAINGDQLLVRSDDDRAWHTTNVALLTEDNHFYNQRIGDVLPGDSKSVALSAFADANGQHYQASMHIKSIWVHAQDQNHDPIDELALPASAAHPGSQDAARRSAPLPPPPSFYTGPGLPMIQ